MRADTRNRGNQTTVTVSGIPDAMHCAPRRRTDDDSRVPAQYARIAAGVRTHHVVLRRVYDGGRQRMTITTDAPAMRSAATHHDAQVAAGNGSVLQRWAWGAFKAEHGWDVARAAGDGFAVQLLLRRRGGVAVGYVPRGPAVCWDDTDAVRGCFAALDALCAEAGVALALIEPDAPLPPTFGLVTYHLVPSPLTVQPLRTIIVACDRSDDALLAAMKQKTRYNVKLAAKRGVTVRQGDAVDLPAFYRLLETTATRDAFGVHTEAYYADLLRAFTPPHDGTLLLAEYAGNLAAAALLIRGGRMAIYLTGASSNLHREHMPTYALQFAALQWARDVGCTHYDLWGIPPTDEPPDAVQGAQQNVRDGLWGVYRFKQGFGGDIVAYPGIVERVYRPLVAPLVRRVLLRRRGIIGG